MLIEKEDELGNMSILKDLIDIDQLDQMLSIMNTSKSHMLLNIYMYFVVGILFSSILGFLIYIGIIENKLIVSAFFAIVLYFIYKIIKLMILIKDESKIEVDEYNNKIKNSSLETLSGINWNLHINKKKFENNRLVSASSVFFSNEIRDFPDKFWREEFNLKKLLLIKDKSLVVKWICYIKLIRFFIENELIERYNNKLKNIGIYYDIYEQKYFIIMRKSLLDNRYEKIFHKFVDEIKNSRIFEIAIARNSSQINFEKDNEERIEEKINDIISLEKCIPNFKREVDLYEKMSEVHKVSNVDRAKRKL